MNTECTARQLEFHGLGRRAVVGKFDGGKLSSDSGGLLLREVEQRTPILKRLAVCFTGHRDAERIAHSLESLIKQRVMGRLWAMKTSMVTTHCVMTRYWHCSVTSRTGPARHVNETRTKAVPWRARAHGTV